MLIFDAGMLFTVTLAGFATSTKLILLVLRFPGRYGATPSEALLMDLHWMPETPMGGKELDAPKKTPGLIAML